MTPNSLDSSVSPVCDVCGLCSRNCAMDECMGMHHLNRLHTAGEEGGAGGRELPDVDEVRGRGPEGRRLWGGGSEEEREGTSGGRGAPIIRSKGDWAGLLLLLGRAKKKSTVLRPGARDLPVGSGTGKGRGEAAERGPAVPPSGQTQFEGPIWGRLRSRELPSPAGGPRQQEGS